MGQQQLHASFQASFLSGGISLLPPSRLSPQFTRRTGQTVVKNYDKDVGRKDRKDKFQLPAGRNCTKDRPGKAKKTLNHFHVTEEALQKQTG